MAGFSGSSVLVDGRWIDGWGIALLAYVGMRVCNPGGFVRHFVDRFRIVEYATRDEAQNAVNTLSNQNLMGRLVYVREVSTLSNGKNPVGLIYGISRIARPSPDSQDLHLLGEVMIAAHRVVVMVEALGAADSGVVTPELLVEVESKFSSTTLVPSLQSLKYMLLFTQADEVRL